MITVGKLPQSTIKYCIEASIKAEGVVEKPDVIGAVFGQTEGLLGADLDLRELQKTGRIGRIEVEIKSSKGKSQGKIIIPSSLGSSETALIAAAIETIERIGPCTASIKVDKVEDTRVNKREFIVKRAKGILKELFTSSPNSNVLSEEIKEDVRTSELTTYKGMVCGPEVETSDSIILVEGRADVINLLKNGIKNAAAINGTAVSENIAELAKEKVITTFFDGDRGGELLLKEILQLVNVDYATFAPLGKEVEELTKKEIFKCLREKAPIPKFSKSTTKPVENIKEKTRGYGLKERYIPTPNIHKDKFKNVLSELADTKTARLFNEKLDVLGNVPVRQLLSYIPDVTGLYAVVFDGTINQVIVDVAERSGIKYLVATQADRVKKSNLIILTKQTL